jgi:hypothetical protein
VWQVGESPVTLTPMTVRGHDAMVATHSKGTLLSYVDRFDVCDARIE